MTTEIERFQLEKPGFQRYEHLITLSGDDTLDAELVAEPR
jgi:hypothetical protein